MADALPPRVIRRITQVYDPTEDRMRLTMADADEKIARLWLTQRLAHRLVHSLTGWLDEDVERMEGFQRAQFMQAWEQAAAQAQFSGGEPVADDVVHESGLLHSVDISHGAEFYAMTFKWGKGESAMLQFNAIELRQWLGILHHLYQQAEWPMAIWPVWFDPQATELPGQVAALH